MGGEGRKAPPPSSKNLSDISYNNEPWHTYTLPKEGVRKYNLFNFRTETLDLHRYTSLTKYRFTPLLGSSILGF